MSECLGFTMHDVWTKDRYNHLFVYKFVYENTRTNFESKLLILVLKTKKKFLRLRPGVYMSEKCLDLGEWKTKVTQNLRPKGKVNNVNAIKINVRS